MLVALLLLLLVFIYIISRRQDVSIRKNALSKSDCKRLIDVANKYQFDTYSEPVDEEPVFQVDIFMAGEIMNTELWEMCQKIQKKHMSHIKKPLSFVFLKRYKPDERTHLNIHFDISSYTSSFLLSDTNDFEGGDFYIFDKKKSRELDDVYMFSTVAKNKALVDKFIENYHELPKLNYEQGDMVSYNGSKHLHGILPVTKGSRYLLTFFFE